MGDNVKEWKVRINHLGDTGTAYIGIIDRFKIHQSLIGRSVYKYGISLDANGVVYCFDTESFQSSKPFKQGDVVAIILDITNNILLLKVNNDCVMVPVTNLNINLQNTEWKLFGSVCNNGDELMILDEDNIHNLDELKQEMECAQDVEFGYSCATCNEAIRYRDCDLNNVQWSASSDSWKHVDCKLSLYELPDLSDSNKNTDQFNKLLAAKSMLPLSDTYTFTNSKGNVYQTMFGIMQITEGIKIWNVRIEHGPSNIHIGIIESCNIKDVSQNSNLVSKNGTYYIKPNGTISGNGIDIPSSVSFQCGDTINVILDMDKGILGFGKSNQLYAVARGAKVKGKSFNLFVTLYSKGSRVSIMKDDQDEDVGFPDTGDIVDTCSQCKRSLFELDFDKNNVEWNDKCNKWQHRACDMNQFQRKTRHKLKLQDRDVWDSVFTNPNIQIYNKFTAIGGNSAKYNLFGAITVSTGLKKWNIRINACPDRTYFGVIRSHTIKRKKTGVPSNEGYYLTHNGCIQGGDLSISLGVTLRVGDVVHIILDKTKNTLCFGVNNSNFVYAKGAVLQNSGFNMFCTSYYQDTSFTILHDVESDAQDEKVDCPSIGKCTECDAHIYEDELKSNNISWVDSTNKWSHKDCKMPMEQNIRAVVPKLHVTATDQWNKTLSHPKMCFPNPYTFIGGNSSYANSFGVITVYQGVKTWDLKVNYNASYMTIGVVDARYTDRNTDIPSHSYYLSHTGVIKGGIPFKAHSLSRHDRMKIILDMNQDTLCFVLNDREYFFVKGAVLKGRSFKLFCNTYYEDSSVSILGSKTAPNHSITKGRALFKCNSCGESIHEFDFDINNVSKNKSDQWCHVECNFNIPNLSPNQRDQWNRMTSNKNIRISSYEASATIGSKHLNAFGICAINQGIKQWNVKIVSGSTSSMCIGIVDSNSVTRTPKGDIKDGYYLRYDGELKGMGLSIKTELSFKTDDTINVYLDMTSNVLSFGKNNTNFTVAKGANIKGIWFNLFCSMNSEDNKICIQ
eukprot:43304_1